jgi:hypothetical protein
MTAAPPATGRHGHAWAMLEFELVDGRPVVRQACGSCGAVRRYRAWERYWDPAAPPGPGITEPGSTARHPARG